jgi:hypothetical protein
VKWHTRDILLNQQKDVEVIGRLRAWIGLLWKRVVCIGRRRCNETFFLDPLLEMEIDVQPLRLSTENQLILLNLTVVLSHPNPYIAAYMAYFGARSILLIRFRNHRAANQIPLEQCRLPLA